MDFGASRHLAQVNLAWMRHPLDHPAMAEFVEGLPRVNAEADAAPGFVWRYQDEGGDATGVRVFDDPRVLFNMSVWQSVKALFAYTYRSGHADFFRRRAEWFDPARRPTLAMWWIEPGRPPTVAEALERLEVLWRAGAGPAAFDFRTPFRPDGTPFPEGWRRALRGSDRDLAACGPPEPGG